MKIAALALAGLIGVTDAKLTNRDLKALEARAKNGMINKQTLMNGAMPYSEAAKRRMEQEKWEINGYYSVQFDACVSLISGNDNLFDENLITYAANGLVKSESSYITFTVCESSNCSNQSSNDKMTFITDVATYFTALAEYLPNQVSNYCEGCEKNYDYCSGSLQANQEQGDAEDGQEQDAEGEGEEDREGEGEGEDREGEGEDRKRRRKLANNRYVEYINCNKCDAYECFANMDNQGGRQLDQEQYDIDGAIEWLNGLAECKQLDVMYDNAVNLYAGLICNEKGDGVEIGVFMDQECSLYTTVKSFADVMSYADQQYYYMSSDIVEYTFTHEYDCQDMEIEYTNPYEENQDEQGQEEDNGEAPGASDYCANLFDNTVNMYDCDINEDGDQQQDENQEQDENMYTYDWYSYEISYQDAGDAQAVCKVLNGIDSSSGKTKSYKGKTVYDSKSSGNLYNYKKARNNNSGSGGGSVAAIVIVGLLAVGAIAFFVINKKKSDSKRAPLINANNNGQMA